MMKCFSERSREISSGIGKYNLGNLSFHDKSAISHVQPEANK